MQLGARKLMLDSNLICALKSKRTRLITTLTNTINILEIHVSIVHETKYSYEIENENQQLKHLAKPITKIDEIINHINLVENNHDSYIPDKERKATLQINSQIDMKKKDT